MTRTVKEPRLRLVMMGTGAFAVPAFRWLAESPYEVVGLVTRRAEPAPHSRHKTRPNPMAEAAGELGLPVSPIADVNDSEGVALLQSLHPDLLVVCDFGTILSPDVLQVAPLGAINLHGSLLPKYRGAAPVQWAVYHGEPTTGVTVIHLTPKLDAGPILVQRETPIEPREDAVVLEERLAVLGVEAIADALEMLQAWDRRSPIGTPQDDALASRAPRLRKSHGRLDWSRSAEALERQIRAFKPWPGSTTWWERKPRQMLPLLVESACVFDRSATPAEPGTVLDAGESCLRIATGRGILDVTELKPAGKRTMTAAEFLRGYRLSPGTVLRSAP